MPNWGEISKRIQDSDNAYDVLRKQYLNTMYKYTGRNIITYYSSFIQKPGIEGTGVDENDKNAFMQAVAGLDRSRGLDLILHTPGGNLAATESIVYYLKKLFGCDIRAFIPQIAMSAGTMIALASKEIVMGKQSNLGPIDPQVRGVSCSAIIDEFNTALKDVKKDPLTAHIWSNILSKYNPTLVGECKNAIKWADSMAELWLKENMFLNCVDADKKVSDVIKLLSSHSATLSHSRHIHGDELKRIGLKIVDLEELDKTKVDDCNDLQDCVLTLHHTYMHTFGATNAMKIVENQNGNVMVMTAKR